MNANRKVMTPLWAVMIACLVLSGLGARHAHARDVLQIGVCSLQMPDFCSADELSRLKRQKAQEEARARRDQADREERLKRERDPAYRARQEAAEREAQRIAAEARRREAEAAAEAQRRENAAVKSQMTTLGLPAHREAEARRLLAMKKAAEQARGVQPTPSPEASKKPAPLVCQSVFDKSVASGGSGESRAAAEAVLRNARFPNCPGGFSRGAPECKSATSFGKPEERKTTWSCSVVLTCLIPRKVCSVENPSSSRQ